jgi:hypothetical protein
MLFPHDRRLAHNRRPAIPRRRWVDKSRPRSNIKECWLQMARGSERTRRELRETLMSRLANDNGGTAMPVLAIIVGVVFVAVLFFKFVDMVGTSSESAGSGEVGKTTSSTR